MKLVYVMMQEEYASAYTNLGTLMQNRGKLQDAIELYRHALQLKPDLRSKLEGPKDTNEKSGESFHWSLNIHPSLR